MTYAFVQAASNGGVKSGGAFSLAVTVTAVGSGNMVAGVVTWGTAVTTDLSSIGDNAAGNPNSGKWVIKHRIADGTNSQSAADFYGYNLTGNPTTITASFGSSVTYIGISVIEFSGNPTTDPIDGTNEQGQLQTAPGTGTDGAQSGAGTQTPSVNNCLVFGASVNTGALNVAGGSEFTAGTNFTEPANAEWSSTGDISLSTEYWIQTTATAANASYTVTQNTAHITFQMIFAPPGGATFVEEDSSTWPVPLRDNTPVVSVW